MPEDPFTGKPLRYRLEKGGYVFYSLGEAERDDAGPALPGQTGIDDVGLRVVRAR